jgi:hypothetical protein
MRDIVEELSSLFKHAGLPMPSAAEISDRAFAKEMGIDIDFEQPTQARDDPHQ